LGALTVHVALQKLFLNSPKNDAGKAHKSSGLRPDDVAFGDVIL
jgi:hypothetical protein